MSISRNPASSAVGERIEIGRIVGAHGVKGVIRVHPLTDYPERFMDMQRLCVGRAGKPSKVLDVEGVNLHEGKGQFLFKVRGIEDRDEAEALTGFIVTVSPEERVALPEGEYWIDSLIGLNVVDMREDGQLEKTKANATLLGIVEDVMPTGGNDVYVVRTPEGEMKLIPAIEEVVREIDLEAGVMRVVIPEGLWD